jgi:hypothetical protein
LVRFSADFHFKHGSCRIWRMSERKRAILTKQ